MSTSSIEGRVRRALNRLGEPSSAVPLALHPAVSAVALGSVSILTMFSLHPVLATISLAGALACSLTLRGVAPTLAGVRWQLPAVALVSLVNPLFSASGSTTVARLGPVVIYAESLAYGAVAGMVMVASLVWMECLARAVPPSVVRSTIGRRAPVAALAMTMTARLVPLLVDRYETVAEAQTANTAAHADFPKGPVAMAATRSGVLLGWALEDSLVRADSMRARGWESGMRRTSYRTYELRGRDVCALVALAVLALASVALAWVACSQWHFYPTMPHLVAWWGYVPFALLAAVPAFASALPAGVRLGVPSRRRAMASGSLPVREDGLDGTMASARRTSGVRERKHAPSRHSSARRGSAEARGGACGRR